MDILRNLGIVYTNTKSRPPERFFQRKLVEHIGTRTPCCMYLSDMFNLLLFTEGTYLHLSNAQPVDLPIEKYRSNKVDFDTFYHVVGFREIR